jgi:quercetin dioxygenase-like cupin family protein
MLRRIGGRSQAGRGARASEPARHHLIANVVTYAPGAKSARHHHAGSVWTHVLSCTIRSENSSTGRAKVYRAGESFFEPPGSEHVLSENASATGPASPLSIHITDDVDLRVPGSSRRLHQLGHIR